MIVNLFRPAGHPRPPYAQLLPVAPTDRVPSLSWICLQRLAPFADDVHHLPVRLNYLPDRSDVLHGPQSLDPRLWATLVQIYDNLPPRFHALSIPLADPHLLRLQRIPHTPRFSLLTILDLPACPHLTDTSIVSLSPLHSLVALDASATSLTAYGIKALAGTLLWVDDGPDRRGPWPLRILRLRYCVNIDDDVYHYLSKFPLLSVVDLRGTDCWPAKDSAFQPCSEMALFHPSPLAAAVDSLTGQDLYSSLHTFNLVIGTLNHPVSNELGSVVIPQESYVFVPSARVKSRFKKDAPTDNYQLQPARKKRVIPKHLTRAGGDILPHCDCDCSCDGLKCSSDRNSEHNFDNEEGSDEDDTQYEDSQVIETLLPALPVNRPRTATQLNEPPIHTDREPQPHIHANFSDLPAYLSESTPDLFYRKPPPSTTPLQYDPEKNYSAQMYYARVHYESLVRPTSRHDAKLALYRNPPPWSALEVHSARLQELAHARPRSVAEGGAGQGVAVVNRAHTGIQIVQARIDALRESASARRRSAVDAAQTQTPGSEVSTSVKDRNPFRRQSGSALEGPNRRMKPLKPISAVKVPVLPVKIQKRPTAMPGAGTSKIKPSSVESASFAGNSQSAATSLPQRTTTATSTWACLELVNRKRSNSDVEAASVKKIKVGNLPVFGGTIKATKAKDDRKHNVTRTKLSDKGISSGKAGFDWGVWGGGGKEQNR